MKSFALFLIGFLFCGQIFAQGMMSAEDLEKEPTYYLASVEDLENPSENGEVKLYTLDLSESEVKKEEVWVHPHNVIQLVVDYFGNDIKQFPREIYEFKHVHSLVLAMWEFPDVPADFGKKLPFIQYLDLQKTKIRAVPDALADLKHLEYLNLTGSTVNPASVAAYKKAIKSTTVFQ